MSTNDHILAAYDQKEHLYRAFAEKLARLLSELIESRGLRVHSITSRPKSRVSLQDKISKQPDYSTLEDITDLAGVRIITYFEDEVDVVAGLIVEQFEVDNLASVDKRSSLDHDRFGYLSLHHIVGLNHERGVLLEYARFATLRAEIQTRSILQHAWAEIEHDLGYKAADEVPRGIRRRFSRLAGVLELADTEFTAVRNELTTYEETVKEEVRAEPGAVEIDRASLTAFLVVSKIVRSVDEEIARALHREVGDEFVNSTVGMIVPRLAALRVESIGEIEVLLERYKRESIAFALKWLDPNIETNVSHGMSVFYLCYVLAAVRGARAVDDLLQRMFSDSPSEDRERFRTNLLLTFQEITKRSD